MILNINSTPDWWIDQQSNSNTISLWWDGRAWKDFTPDLLVGDGGGITGAMTQSTMMHEFVNYVGFASGTKQTRKRYNIRLKTLVIQSVIMNHDYSKPTKHKSPLYTAIMFLMD